VILRRPKDERRASYYSALLFPVHVAKYQHCRRSTLRYWCSVAWPCMHLSLHSANCRQH